MAVTVERLIATLEANFSKYDRALNKALGNTERTFTRIERRGKQMESRLSALGSSLGRNVLGGLAAGVSLRGAQSLIDQSTRIQNALKVAGLAGAELTKVYDQLFASAQRNAVPIEAMATLYGRLAQAQDALNVSQEEMTNFTDKIGVALRVSGASAAQASGALLQLSQALGAGIVRAEEYNSINEGARPILQAVAAGLKEAGGDVAKLRQLVLDGKVSSEAFFRAFEVGAVILEDKVASAEITVSQGFVRLQNTLVAAAGKFDKVIGASTGTVEVLDRLAGIMNGLGNVFQAVADGPVGTFISRMAELDALIRKILPVTAGLGLITEENLNRLAGAIGPSAGPNFVRTTGGKGPRVVPDPIQSRIDTAFGTGEVKQVSLADFALPDSGKNKKGAKERADEYERLAARISDATSALVAETEVQRGLNPLVDDYGYAVEKARAEQELLNAALHAGKTITPELRAAISELAHQYATATVEAAQLAETQDEVREHMEEMRDLGRDVMGGFISDLRQGKSASEALANALQKVADKLLDIALNGLFEGKGGGGGFFGFIGKLFGGGGGGIDYLSLSKTGAYLFHKGGVVGQGGQPRSVHPSVFAGAPRMHGGGVAGLRADEVPAILQRGEIVIPKGMGRGASGSGASERIDINVIVSGARGNAEIEAMVASGVRQGLAGYDKARGKRYQAGGQFG